MTVDSTAAPASTPPMPVAGLSPLSPEAWLWGGRVPFLDGLRAVSIVIVIVSHLQFIYRDRRHPTPWYLLARGSVGVDVFFVISGFLITLLLLREHRRRGGVSLKAFYLRRVLRIFPAYFLFVAAAFAIAGVQGVPIPGSVIATACTFTTSYLGAPYGPGGAHHFWNTSHLWSLSVEETFYLVWPAVFVFAGRRAGFAACCAYVVAVPLMRWLLLKSHFTPSYLAFFAPTRCDTIAFGCCLAILLTGDTTRRLVRYAALALGPPGLAVVFVLNPWLMLYTRRPGVALYRDVFMSTADALAITAVCAFLLTGTLGVVTRVLNLRPLVWLGVLSYSLYLWQQPFTQHGRKLGPAFELPWNMAIVFVCALASYFLVERPFLTLKAKSSERRSLDDLAPGTVGS